MCDACTNDPKFKSAPGTSERFAELEARTHERILEFGQEITGVSANPVTGDAAFYYTVGRSVFALPELYLTGNLSHNTAGYMLNHLNRLERAGEIDVASLIDGQEHMLDGFGCALKFVKVDPGECEMNKALQLGDVEAIQVIWPDADGRWPDNPAFAYGPDAQPVRG